jgi:hypothetical protein
MLSPTSTPASASDGPPAGYRMTAKAGNHTYQQFRAQQWTDDALKKEGYIELATPPVPDHMPALAADALLATYQQAMREHYTIHNARPPKTRAERQAATDRVKAAGRAALEAGVIVEKPPPHFVTDEPPLSPSVKPIDWGKLSDNPPRRKWIIDDWVGAFPTLLAGKGGSGKTTVAQAIATSLAMGADYIGQPSEPKTVLFWNCEEDLEQINITQAAINRHFKITMAELKQAGRLHMVVRCGEENTLLGLASGTPTFTSLFTDELREQINDLKADVIFIDNVVQVYGGGLNDAHQVTMFVNALAGLVKDRPFTPILLGHVAKTAGSEFSGTMAWENAVRMRWYLGATLPDERPHGPDEPAPATDTAFLARRKANYAAKDFRELKYQGGLFVPTSPSVVVTTDGVQVIDGAKAREEHVDELVMEGMRRLIAQGIQPSDKPQSPDYLPRQMVNQKLNINYRERDLKAAMHRLIGAGWLRRDKVGNYRNRDPRYGLVIV